MTMVVTCAEDCSSHTGSTFATHNIQLLAFGTAYHVNRGVETVLDSNIRSFVLCKNKNGVASACQQE
jgi:hypothetical protein